MELINTIPNQLSIPGAEFNHRSLKIDPNIEKENLGNVNQLLSSVASCSSWWVGDLLTFVRDRAKERARKEKLEEHPDIDPEELEKLATEAGNESVWNVINEAYDSEVAAVSMEVCSAIPPEYREFNLSFKHYREALLLSPRDVKAAAARDWLEEAERNNWSVSQLRKQIRLDQADRSTNLTIRSIDSASVYQHINSLYSFIKSCDVDEDAPILDKLEEDARSLIKVISEKRNTRTRGLPVAVPEGRSAHAVGG